MFLDLDKKEPSSIAVIDFGSNQISYGELNVFASEFYKILEGRTLIFILSENCIGSLAGYLASLSSGIVPLLLSCNIDRDLLNNLIQTYHPEYLWLPERLTTGFAYPKVFAKYDFCLLKTRLEPFELNEDLSLLLTTSGSTGSPKLVRHSYANVESNARNVSHFFELTPDERPISILPLQYTMGLSVVTSHLYAGSKVLLISGNLTDKRFWSFIKDQMATSFTGVPFSYEILHKLRFFNMDLPFLRLLTQGGGRLSDELFKAFAEYAHRTGRRFIATYGQTEGTARMAYLPAEMALKKIGSIGNAIPEGQLFIIDENGKMIEEKEAVGEMVYKGPNVTMGYALKGEDLKKGDELKGVLFTGDISRRDSDGYYYIVGRMSRFLKLYGLRISMDEIEQMVKSKFGTDCMCMGNDDKMNILITDSTKKEAIAHYILDKTGLFHKAVEVIIIEKIPRNEAGKNIINVGTV